ncbi:uncharacterized protein VTP21DRAFT_3831 [Calcarisporiella thermophila]|uniref:uncharacterized protein n=1 Tax=Calcarisporiella thermophila TaxID=911321 RepID=UPI003744979E
MDRSSWWSPIFTSYSNTANSTTVQNISTNSPVDTTVQRDVQSEPAISVLDSNTNALTTERLGKAFETKPITIESQPTVASATPQSTSLGSAPSSYKSWLWWKESGARNAAESSSIGKAINLMPNSTSETKELQPQSSKPTKHQESEPSTPKHIGEIASPIVQQSSPYARIAASTVSLPARLDTQQPQPRVQRSISYSTSSFQGKYPSKYHRRSALVTSSPAFSSTPTFVNPSPSSTPSNTFEERRQSSAPQMSVLSWMTGSPKSRAEAEETTTLAAPFLSSSPASASATEKLVESMWRHKRNISNETEGESKDIVKKKEEYTPPSSISVTAASVNSVCQENGECLVEVSPGTDINNQSYVGTTEDTQNLPGNSIEEPSNGSPNPANTAWSWIPMWKSSSSSSKPDQDGEETSPRSKPSSIKTTSPEDNPDDVKGRLSEGSSIPVVDKDFVQSQQVHDSNTNESKGNPKQDTSSSSSTWWPFSSTKTNSPSSINTKKTSDQTTVSIDTRTNELPLKSAREPGKDEVVIGEHSKDSLKSGNNLGAPTELKKDKSSSKPPVAKPPQASSLGWLVPSTKPLSKDAKNVILPTFESQFGAPPTLSPSPSKSLVQHALHAFHTYFFSGKRPKNRISRFLDDITRTNLDKRFVVIGVHGWFPTKLVRSVIGEPTGTSTRFCELMAQSLNLYFQEVHGVDLPESAITQIPLEGEGKVEDRVELLYRNLLRSAAWCDAIASADAILVVAHSQGTPVSAMLLSRLIQEGRIEPQRQAISMLAMAGISHGPFPALKGNLIVRYFEAAAARELFEFMDSSTTIASKFREALSHILQVGVKLTLVGSLQDQVVPLYSAIMHGANHPSILRAVYIDAHIYQHDFLTELIVFALRLRNRGLHDHGLLVHLSEVLAGSLYSDQSHSTIYEEIGVYTLAIQYLLEAPKITCPASAPVLNDFKARSRSNPFYLPWAMRGVMDDANILADEELRIELEKLRELFERWEPLSAKLKEIKFRLEPLRARL